MKRMVFFIGLPRPKEPTDAIKSKIPLCKTKGYLLFLKHIAIVG